MLTELLIADFAIIDRMELRLGPGLNVVTGETGAGKSIVIDAISYVLGARGGPSLVRSGARQARVEATFCPVTAEVAALLDSWNVSIEDGTVVLSRETTAAGRNVYRVNGTMVTQAMLRSAGELLVEIHGQHDTFSLLSPSRHLDLLDRLGGAPLAERRAQVAALYARWKALRDEQGRLLADARERERRREWLTFEADEIESMHLCVEPDELSTLETERGVLANADKIHARTEEALNLLDGADGDGGVRTAMGRVARLLNQIEAVDPAAAAVASTVAALSVTLDELRRDLSHYADGVDADPRRLEQVNERLSAIHRLQKKYGPTVPEIVAYGVRARAELEALEESEGRAHELDAEIAGAAAELGVAAGVLSGMRRELAATLEGQVAAELRGLEMPHTRFGVRFDEESAADGLAAEGESPRVGPNGCDRLEFLISANPGQPLQALARIASGGEMSRVMLAMQSVLARVNPVSTMIFDEVDAGLGGIAAEAVAARLRKIAAAPSRQVICVTHLPLVAAAATVHWSLTKHVEDGRTASHARDLSDEHRAEEIARMLAGKQASETTLRQAQEMLRHPFESTLEPVAASEFIRGRRGRARRGEGVLIGDR